MACPSQSDDRSPQPVYLHVGARIRMRRKVLRTSQEKLANDLGLTFQQVHKYERGTNRVSASKLYEVARSLHVPVTYFFERLGDPTSDKPPKVDLTIQSFLMSPEGIV